MTHVQKSSKKALRELRRNTVSQESIAMENPCWTPEPVHTNANASRPHDWSIPEFNGTPIYIPAASEQMSGEVTPNMENSNILKRKHVTPGERHALLADRKSVV